MSFTLLVTANQEHRPPSCNPFQFPRGETTNPRNRPCSERTRIFPVSPTGDVPGVSDDLANVLDVLLSVVGDDEDVVQVYDYWHIQVLP